MAANSANNSSSLSCLLHRRNNIIIIVVIKAVLSNIFVKIKPFLKFCPDDTIVSNTFFYGYI